MQVANAVLGNSPWRLDGRRGGLVENGGFSLGSIGRKKCWYSVVAVIAELRHMRFAHQIAMAGLSYRFGRGGGCMLQ